jgi:hypothetical protein
VIQQPFASRERGKPDALGLGVDQAKAERALTRGQLTLAAERQLPANYLMFGKAAERV